MLAYITAPVQPHHRAMLEAAAGDRCRVCYQEDGRDYLTEAEIIIGETTPQDLLRAQKLQWFHLVWAGADRYKSHFFPAGALFTNGSGAYGAYIAEHVIGGILCLYRQLRHYEALQKAHIWDQKWQETTLEGKTVLILGTGDLGGSLAKRLQGFDCRILGICRSGQPQPGFHAMHTLADLDRLLPLVDVVVGCLPSTQETIGLMDARHLRMMKKNALLVNCGRGSFVVTKDLEDVLESGHLAGCVLDVTDPEPLPADSRLWDMEHVIITPHISGISFGHLPEMEDRIYRMAAENLRRYLDGESLLNRVDFETGYRMK